MRKDVMSKFNPQCYVANYVSGYVGNVSSECNYQQPETTIIAPTTYKPIMSDFNKPL